eukprot:scaffold23348_cov57-Phaeocystis_antarctica.AAC.1
MRTRSWPKSARSSLHPVPKCSRALALGCQENARRPYRGTVHGSVAYWGFWVRTSLSMLLCLAGLAGVAAYTALGQGDSALVLGSDDMPVEKQLMLQCLSRMCDDSSDSASNVS